MVSYGEFLTAKINGFDIMYSVNGRSKVDEVNGAYMQVVNVEG